MTATSPPVDMSTVRDPAQRKSDALELLASETTMWISTAATDGVPHLIPVCYVWDGTHLTTATAVHSATVRNLTRTPLTRVAVGHPYDVVLVDATTELVTPDDIDTPTADAYARISLDPRQIPGFVYLRLTPRRMLVWRHLGEFQGREVMRDGRWAA